MRINKRLFKAVKAQILRRPKNFFMRWWGIHIKRTQVAQYTDEDLGCGSVCCIAGWGWMIANRKRRLPKKLYDIAVAAEKLFGLTTDEADRVFDASNWPEPFKERYLISSSAEERAQVAADYIDHILKEGVPV